MNYEEACLTHVTAAQSQMGVASQALSWSLSKRAFRQVVGWMADYARRYPDWLNQLKGVFERPIVDGIVAKMGIHNAAERTLVTVFVGCLLDGVFNTFLELAQSGQLWDVLTAWGF